MKKILLSMLLSISTFFSIVHAAEVKVAAVEFNPTPKDVSGNIQRIVKAITEASNKGAKLMVLPEFAVTGFGYIPSGPGDFDTIPGRATAAIEKVTRKYNNYVVVGTYELDPVTGVIHNAAALVGPKGLIGKYRKNQIPPGDYEIAAPGNLGFPVFNTDIGKIALLICFDDTRLQSLLLPSLRGADILATPIGSDMMPKYEKISNGNHSTISNIAVLASWVGMNVVASNQTGLVNFPTFGVQDQFTGGSTIWDNNGNQLAHSKVSTWTKPLPAETIYATINPTKKSEQKTYWLNNRRPELYRAYNLYKAPVDIAANNTQNQISALLVQYSPSNGNIDANVKKVDSLIAQNQNVFNLVVLPFNSFIGNMKLDKNNIRGYAEPLNGKSYGLASELAKKYKTYLLFSMPEVDGEKYYETAVLFDFNGKQAGIYRKSHLNDE